MATPLFEPGALDVLYIVDLSGYVFRAYHAIAPLNSPTTGEPTQAVYGTVAMLEKMVRTRRPALLAVAMDSKGPTFRKEIYQEYKAHRPPQPPDLGQQMARCREMVDAFAIPVFQKEGFEADDLIASAVAQARARKWRVVIVSADKDLMQLVGDDVVLWDTMRDKVFGTAEVLERFGVGVAQVRDWLALTGDTSDNIPGVPSVGPKTARDLLVEFGDIDGIYANIDRIDRKALREKLRENEDAARLSQHLVTLRADVPCEFEPEKLRYGGRDVPRLRHLYGELGFTRQLAALDTEPEPALPAVAQEKPRAAMGEQTGFAFATEPKPAPSPTSLGPTRTILTAGALDQARSALAAGTFSIVAEQSTEAPMRGVLVGLGLSTESESFYLPLGHRYVGAPAELDANAARAALGPLFADAALPKVCHDGKQVKVALARAGMTLAGVTFDTMLASYLIDPEASHTLEELSPREIAAGVVSPSTLVPKVKGREVLFDEVPVEEAASVIGARAAAVRRLSDRLSEKLAEEQLTDVLTKIELPLSGVLAEMERAGVLVDPERLRALGERVEKQLAALEKEAHRIAGREFNVHSPRQLEALLFDELALKHVRRTKTSRSTDADTLEVLAEQHELPKVILDIRQLSKLKGTYIDTLPTLLHPETKRIHTRWEQAVAATGRLSSSDPNLQNIPIRSDLGREIRAAFIAPPGHLLVSADYSQIELRVLAHLSKDPVLVDSFRSGQDVHTRTAIEVFGVKADEVTAEMRRRAKAVNFGIVYGQGDSGLAKSLGIPRAEAASFIAAYFRKYEGVRRFMSDVLETARAAGSIRTIFGRRRMVPDIRSENRSLRLAAERVAMNTPIQGTAADLLKLAMLAFREPPSPGARMVLTVHDELVFEVPEAEVDVAAQRIRAAMESVHPLEVPLVVDVGRGKNWSDAH
ncbi:MAG TPA: DNA polymerase I [Polyangiaceae bacterium]|nr:DNA polymerase I [Polyangiaceae bacterium]